MGRHRALAHQVRRGIAWWPIVVFSLVVLLVLSWLGWSWVEATLDRRAAAQALACHEGGSSLRVAVAPSVAEPVRKAADRWNARNTVVYDHCIHVDVATLAPDQVLAGLTGEWNTAQLGERPQAWLPDSSFWVNQLSAANNGLLGSAPESVATSPVVLAVPEEAVKPLADGDSFVWGDLPQLASASDGWSRYGRPDWGRFGLALPDPAKNPASGLALQCVLAGAGPQRSGPVTTQMLTLPAVQQALTQLVGARPAAVPATTRDALVALAGSDGVAGAPFDAVPVTEVDLYRRNLGLDGAPKAAHTLFEVAARGPSPAADFPFVALAGPGVDDTQARAAQKFREFLREPDQQREFNLAGLRAAGGADYPRESPGISWGSATTSLIPADANTAQQISATWASAADGGEVVTLLVDVSRSMSQDGGGGRSKLDWVKDALHGQADRAVSSSMGLWVFSRRLDGDRPYRQLAPTRPVAEQRGELNDAVNAMQPVGDAFLYLSLAEVYRSAVNGFVAGRPNRVVVITDAANDGGMSFDDLRAQLRDLHETRQVPISVIAIGPEPNAQELREITRTTGGRLSVLTEAKGVDAALGQLLSVSD